MNENPFIPANRLPPAEASPPANGTSTVALGRPGTYGRARFVLRDASLGTSSRGPFLKVTFGDRFGEVPAICWKGAVLAPKLTVGTVIELERLTVDDKGVKFEVEDLRILDRGEFQPNEFLQSLPAPDIDANWREFQEFLDSVRRPELQDLRRRIWDDPLVGPKYKTHPSAVYHHHNYVGGNVQHVVGIMRLVEGLCSSYPRLDRDLLVFGAAVHDLGKLREYEVGTTIRVTDEGRLRGHLVIGAEWISQFIEDVRRDGTDFPKTLEEDLVHMILSHHGKGEWGSPKPPATAEAMALHLCDYADSQAKKFLQDVEANADNPEGWVRKFDHDIGESRWIRTRRDDGP